MLHYSEYCDVFFALEDNLFNFFIKDFASLEQVSALARNCELAKKNNWHLLTFKKCKWLNKIPCTGVVSSFIDFCIKTSNTDSQILYKYEYFRQGENEEDYGSIGANNSPFKIDKHTNYDKVNMQDLTFNIEVGSIIEDSSGMLGLVTSIDNNKNLICIEWNTTCSLYAFEIKSDLEFCLFTNRWKALV